MAWIELPPVEQASGLLARIYDAAVKRAGRVFNILRIQSRRPRALSASMQLYQEVMLSPHSGLVALDLSVSARLYLGPSGLLSN